MNVGLVVSRRFMSVLGGRGRKALFALHTNFQPCTLLCLFVRVPSNHNRTNPYQSRMLLLYIFRLSFFPTYSCWPHSGAVHAARILYLHRVSFVGQLGSCGVQCFGPAAMAVAAWRPAMIIVCVSVVLYCVGVTGCSFPVLSQVDACLAVQKTIAFHCQRVVLPFSTRPPPCIIVHL